VSREIGKSKINGFGFGVAKAVALILIPLGFGTKYYSSIGETWVRHYAGGVLYVVFLCSVWRIISPRSKPSVIGMGVLTLTCVVEVSQLWHPAFLGALRSGIVGGAVLGSEFDWWDFPHYVASAAAAIFAMRALDRFEAAREEGLDGIS
jgi:hypothetical protein